MIVESKFVTGPAAYITEGSLKKIIFMALDLHSTLVGFSLNHIVN